MSQNSNNQVPKSKTVNGITIDDTFAEAFGMSDVRLVVTARDEHWRDAALREVCGYSS